MSKTKKSGFVLKPPWRVIFNRLHFFKHKIIIFRPTKPPIAQCTNTTLGDKIRFFTYLLKSQITKKANFIKKNVLLTNVGHTPMFPNFPI